jgi:hypothetical protein
VQLRMPARWSREPAASFSSSSSSSFTSRRARFPAGRLPAPEEPLEPEEAALEEAEDEDEEEEEEEEGARRAGADGRERPPRSSQRSESSSLWKPSLPARRRRWLWPRWGPLSRTTCTSFTAGAGGTAVWVCVCVCVWGHERQSHLRNVV